MSEGNRSKCLSFIPSLQKHEAGYQKPMPGADAAMFSLTLLWKLQLERSQKPAPFAVPSWPSSAPLCTPPLSKCPCSGYLRVWAERGRGSTPVQSCSCFRSFFCRIRSNARTFCSTIAPRCRVLEPMRRWHPLQAIRRPKCQRRRQVAAPRCGRLLLRGKARIREL